MGCLGNQLRQGRKIDTPWPWERSTRTVVTVALLALTVTTLLWWIAPEPSAGALAPSTPAGIDPVQTVPIPTLWPTPTPAPPPTVVVDEAGLRFHIESLVACGQNLLRLYRKRRVSVDSAETESINGQRVTMVGRSPEEALDRVKQTYQQEAIFYERAQVAQQELNTQLSRYLELVAHLMKLPKVAVRAAVARLERENLTVPPRNALAAQLVCQHVEDCLTTGGLTLERVRTDYEHNSLR